MLSDRILLSIASEILRHYTLDRSGIHGIKHWGRVLETGERLAALTAANVKVVQLFALFHDSRRMNDNRDPDHGARGAALAGEMNGKHFTLSPSELALLQDACSRHTLGFTEADITVQTCWDADRLDLPRVGIYPTPNRLCTAPARDPKFMAWAGERSVSDYRTPFASQMSKLIS